MKKFLSTLLLCSIGTLWSFATDGYVFTPNNKTIGNDATAYITSQTTFTFNGIGWAFNQLNPSTLQVKTNQSDKTAEFYIYNTTAFSNNVSQVVLKFQVLAFSNPSNSGWYVSYGTSKIGISNDFTTDDAVQGVWNSTDKTLTFDLPDKANATFISIWQNGKVSTGTNKLATSDAITIKFAEEGEPTPGKETPVISFSETSVNFDCGIADEVYGLPTLQTSSDGAVSYEISDDALIEDDGSMAYIEKPGTYTVTATVAETDTYAEASASYTIIAYSSLKTVIFKETFDTNDGTGGNDGSWSGSIATNNITFDNSDWTFANEGGANKCIRLGTSSKKGSAETPALSVIDGTLNCVLTFKAAAWDGKDEKTTLNLSISDGGSLSETSVTLVKGQWTDYTINITGATANSKIKFEAANANSNRFFLDEIEIFTPKNSQTLSIGSEGMTTFSSKNALDFTNAQNITAWVTHERGLENGIIYLEQVTGTVAGGTGLILMGEPNATENIPVVESGDNYDSQNLLVKWYNGATIDASDGQNYVLAKIKNSPDFGFMNITNNLTNKTGIHHSYLHILDAAGNSPALRVVFGNGDTTGINDITVDNANEDGEMYNILGQKVDNSYRGFVIKNGEKFINK